MSRRKLPRGTAAQLNAATFLPGEIAVDTTNDELRYDGDGSTVGGIALARKDGTNLTAGPSSVTATGSTTARTLAARFAEVGNVKDFGALGDGSTDDTAAIEAALAVWEAIYIPPGIYMLGSRLDVPAGKKIYGAGFNDTILRASATGYNGMTVGSNCVLLDFTIDGNSKGGAYSGILFDGVSGCFTDRVAAINWGADGFAITNAAHHNKFGEIYATTNGSRGVIIDPNSYSNQIGSVDTRGSTNSGLLIGHNSYRNQIGLLICGGHQNCALWIHNAAYENQIDCVIVEAPATGYENNSAILLGWNAQRNTIGQATVTGWRRGVQLKGDDADATYTDGDTQHNHIGALYVTTDGGANAAGVSMDANNSYYAKHNSIGKLHVKTATYGIIDTNGTNTPNYFDFSLHTFDSVTTPYSLTEGIGQRLWDSNFTHQLIVKAGANLTADRILTVTTADSAQTLDISSLSSTGVIDDGLYTPTLTGVANVDASTAYECQYIRVGAIVTVSGKVDLDPTAGATLTQLGISLPVASNLADAAQCAGSASSNGGANGYGSVVGDATNNRAELYCVPTANTNNAWYFTFTYRII